MNVPGLCKALAVLAGLMLFACQSPAPPPNKPVSQKTIMPREIHFEESPSEDRPLPLHGKEVDDLIIAPQEDRVSTLYVAPLKDINASIKVLTPPEP